ncbi:MAG: transposase, partial [Anaerolineae bacterium]|nr:transposase [Anaerolineae bacterium]
MPDILALLQCLDPCVSAATLRQMSIITTAIITMTGRVTMLGISRWTREGGSYRTVQRFFQTIIPWPSVFWWFFREHCFEQGEVYILAGDECVVSKSGQQTPGLDRFFSSLYGKPIPSVSFFSLSLVGTQERRSYPMMVEQVIRTEAEKAAAKAKKQAKKAQSKTKKRKPGRPKGSQNKDKTQMTLTPELARIKGMVLKQVALINGEIPLTYLVLDGHFGNNNALQMTRQCGLHLISKLRHDAALYVPYDGVQNKYGARRKYDDKLNYKHIPVHYLKESLVEDGIRTDTYQAILLHKDFAQPLNVVIIVKTDLKTGKRGHVVLFSSDLDLSYTQLIDCYSLRFQIEFKFRDAKQYWGLEDFMNISATAVTNAANLSLFMVNLTQPVLRDLRQDSLDVGILDLKAHYRGHKYVTETLKLLPEMPEPIL